ncbi:MAG: sigma-70 family RNA polymerase sigma factor, partial [Clostridia bacterium]
MTDNQKDLERLRAFRAGDAKALEDLMADYRGLVNMLSRPYYLVGADFEDIVQEGWLGLYKAVIGFDIQEKTSFYSYAYSCVKNKILDALKA